MAEVLSNPTHRHMATEAPTALDAPVSGRSSGASFESHGSQVPNSELQRGPYTKESLESKDAVVIVDSKSSSQDSTISPEQHRRLLRRLDLIIAPCMMIIYMVAFLDRTNIGNAKVAGLPEDLHLKGNQFNVATSIFYATFIVFEMPTTLLMKRFQPKQTLSFIIFAYSITTLCTGFVKNYSGLIATRLILGACEAGLFPCLTVYLTMVYTREELAPRIAYLFSAAAISGAFGGLFAYGILQMNGVAGFAGWRWLFVIEGILSFLCSIMAFFVFPNDPKNAWFLNSEMRGHMRIRENARTGDLEEKKWSWKGVRLALSDPKLYIMSIAEFGQDTCLYGFSTFLPAIIRAMGHQGLSVQYLTIPVYAVGAVCFLTASYISDRIRSRGIVLIINNIFPIVGYILLLTRQGHPSVLYFACYMCGIGIYTGAGLPVTWISGNVAPHYKRATSISFMMATANSSGILSGQIYRWAPKYIAGHATSLIAISISTILHFVTIMYLRRQNRKRQAFLDSGADVGEKATVADDSNVHFRYVI
ncbi:nicotinic acid plasma membrane transporter [Schizosaccharomyces japonicus yFS275]|uniref:Nicotinic acid plasma membrane transporter n=1 Tax=Schizosaccharomyces japonicus (strain yFS275 / FY16936) TaxID=402676 RepID=B6K7J3_SCHJY|nr:nicotinic acid plasma membrane transporter [Schizosaccharomyces japonicus yFS275]EEB09497.2 nicotinic acid plasma membrane transporter [Schizosaccharomyces japonicus yFS275]